MTQILCSFCGGRLSGVVNTYKHVWRSCGDCGNVFRTRKPKYLAEILLPKQLGARLPLKLQKGLLREQNVVAQEHKYYDYYSQASSLWPERTKWDGETDVLLSQLSALGVSVAGKSVLDVSGGPGFLVKDLESLCTRVVVTEFSEEAVAGMRNNLGIEAIKFDFNADNLEDAVRGQFDIVLVRYAINFCDDVRLLANSLSRVINDGGLIYVSFVAPSLGCCLRWQHDEYTFNVLYNPDTLALAFCHAGLKLRHRGIERDYPYTHGRSWKTNLYALPYRIGALLSTGTFNRELLQKNRVMLFAAPHARSMRVG